jgi:hypothetical protein
MYNKNNMIKIYILERNGIPFYVGKAKDSTRRSDPSNYTEKQKQKMKGLHPGTGEKISKTLKEKNHSQYYTDEIKQKISQNNKEKPKPFSESHKIAMGIAKRKQAKPVLQCDLENNIIK